MRPARDDRLPVMTFTVPAQAETMEELKQCVDASTELCDLQDEMDVLATQLEHNSLTKRDYEMKHTAHLEQRDKIIGRTPHFWMRALISHPSVGMLVTVSDCMRLEALTNVECIAHNSADFDIVFSFGENSFFSNRKLTKTYRNKEWSGLCVGVDEVRWKEGMAPDGEFANLDGQCGMHCESFFAWFERPDDARQLGEVIRDELLPNAVNLFLGSWYSSYELWEDTDSDSSTSNDTGE